MVCSGELILRIFGLSLLAGAIFDLQWHSIIYSCIGVFIFDIMCWNASVAEGKAEDDRNFLHFRFSEVFFMNLWSILFGMQFLVCLTQANTVIQVSLLT